MAAPSALALANAGLVEPNAAGAVALLVLFVVLALLFSFLCSVAEATLLSITPSYIAGLREEQPAKAALLKKLREDDLDRSLAAILTLNTIAHTVGAIGAGAQATIVFGDAWFGVFSAVMTLLILFGSEILPKTLGAVYWRRLTGPTARFVAMLIFLMYPLIVVSQALTRWVSGNQKPPNFNRDEFVAMAGLGEEDGHISDRESKIIRNLFLFKSVTAGSVMTPRVVMSALDVQTTVDEAMADTGQGRPQFSRMPVYESSIDGVVGFVLLEDLLVARAEGRGSDQVGAFRRDIVPLPSGTPLSKALETLLEQQQHIALVVGEYGETKGIVTLEDVVETLLGDEIVDEGDDVEDMQQLARQLWAKRARKLGLSIESSDTSPQP